MPPFQGLGFGCGESKPGYKDNGEKSHGLHDDSGRNELNERKEKVGWHEEFPGWRIYSGRFWVQTGFEVGYEVTFPGARGEPVLICGAPSLVAIAYKWTCHPLPGQFISYVGTVFDILHHPFESSIELRREDRLQYCNGIHCGRGPRLGSWHSFFNRARCSKSLRVAVNCLRCCGSNWVQDPLLSTHHPL